MCAVVLQVGQCGNQLGLDWWKLLTEKSHQHKRRCPFSSRNGELAAVCVDSEPKVLRTVVKNKEIHPSSIIERKGGRGGNWAYGYHGGGAEGENGLLQHTMEAVRREAERQDYYGGTVVLHSLSGGTGSGLGSRLCEEIREEFPVGHILTVSVVPHQSGESPLQHYNTLLGLAALHRSSDGMLLFHNDHALSRARFQQKSHVGSGAVSCGFSQNTLSAMNAHITSCMAGLLLPVKTLTTLSEKTHWDTLVSKTLQNLPQFSPDGKPYSSRAVLAVARGNQDNSFIVSNVLQKLRQAHRCVHWNPFPVEHWTDPRNEVNVSLSGRILTVCTNHSSVTRLLCHISHRATEMLSVRAYLHWYERYGMEKEEFQQALNTLSSLAEEYESQ